MFTILSIQKKSLLKKDGVTKVPFEEIVLIDSVSNNIGICKRFKFDNPLNTGDVVKLEPFFTYDHNIDFNIRKE